MPPVNPDCRSCYCFQMLLAELSFSHEVKTRHTIPDRSHVNLASGCIVPRHVIDLSWHVGYNGSRQVIQVWVGFCRLNTTRGI